MHVPHRPHHGLSHLRPFADTWEQRLRDTTWLESGLRCNAQKGRKATSKSQFLLWIMINPISIFGDWILWCIRQTNAHDITFLSALLILMDFMHRKKLLYPARLLSLKLRQWQCCPQRMLPVRDRSAIEVLLWEVFNIWWFLSESNTGLLELWNKMTPIFDPRELRPETNEKLKDLRRAQQLEDLRKTSETYQKSWVLCFDHRKSWSSEILSCMTWSYFQHERWANIKEPTELKMVYSIINKYSTAEYSDILISIIDYGYYPTNIVIMVIQYTVVQTNTRISSTLEIFAHLYLYKQYTHIYTRKCHVWDIQQNISSMIHCLNTKF